MIFFDHLEDPLSRNVADICSVAGTKVVDISKNNGLRKSIEKFGIPDAFVISPSQMCETVNIREALKSSSVALEIGRLLHNDTISFLENCRVVLNAMITKRKGQILFLGVDDVAARIVGLPESPIFNQLRVSALKSLAKEYGRMNIRFNTIIQQPSKEVVSADTWKKNRESLKVYMMRYTPNHLTEYAHFCKSVLCESIPLNGGVLYLGKGMMEMIP